MRLNEIKTGDLFLKYSPNSGDEWHHIGIITKVFENGVVYTIEGNASGKTLEGAIGDTDDGTGVFKKSRNLFDRKVLKNKAGKK